MADNGYVFLCSDKPLYALQKSISWAYAAQFIKEESKVDILPVLVHFKKILLSCIGELVKGTGLGDVLKSAGVLMVGQIFVMYIISKK